MLEILILLLLAAINLPFIEVFDGNVAAFGFLVGLATAMIMNEILN